MRIVSVAAMAAVLSLTLAGSGAMAASSQPPVRNLRNLAPAPSSYADFLVGRFAMNVGDVDAASKALSSAAAIDPADGDLREKAFLINILSGNIDQASQLTGTTTRGTKTGKVMSGLVGAVSAAKSGKAGETVKAVDAVLKVDNDERSAALLRPYALAMGGQWKAALDDSGDAALNANDRGRLLVYLIKAERARLHEIKGDKASAEALYKDLYQPGAASFIFGPDYAGFLERQGRKDEARTVLQAIADTSADPASRINVARLDAPGYKPTPLPDLKASMAQALLLSATLYSSDHDLEMALANLRLSLYLDGTSDRARIFLGQVEQELKDTASAEAAWASIPLSSPYLNEATLRRIWSLRGREQNDDALALADAGLARQPDNISFTVEKADILHDQGKDQAALDVLSERISRSGDKDFTWQAWFIQAIAYDAVNDWPNAETAIKKAQALQGDRPEILNFLGYGWIDRGLHVKEGMDLVRQAMSLSPRSGAIVDSLGWGYYKLGDYDQALSFIEQAVLMEPSDAEVNEHLGDVYKALGRDTEARYEWQRVLTLNATAKETASVKAKIEANAPMIAGAAGLSKPMPAKAETTALNDQAPAPAKTK